MTKLQDLETLLRISQLKHDRATQAMRPVLTEEARLRQALSDLDALSRQPVEILRQSGTGADIHWQKWLARNRNTLNLALARTLAAKENHLAALRLSHGVVSTLTQITDQTALSQRRKKRQVEMENLIAASVQARWPNPQ